MTEATPADSPAEGLPSVEVHARRGIPLVWAVPLVAALIAAWLAYTTLTQRGPLVTITFLTAAGLEAGKTLVKYRDVDIGTIENVELATDGSHISVTARLKKGAEAHLNSNTKFWVVRPRLSASGVSGLGTLVSGAYIELEPGAGERTTSFTGLEVPPVVRAHVAGRRFVLRSNRLGSLQPSSPVTFRGIDVGEVLGYELDDDGGEVSVHVFVRKPHDQLVRQNSRFWNASGIDISVGADGVNITTASLEAMLAGGVAFDTPVSASEQQPAADNHVFALFDNLASVTDASYTQKISYVAYFSGSVRGLVVGAPVEFRGIRVGSVTDVRIEVDPVTATVQIPVTFQIEPQRVNLPNITIAEASNPHTVMEKLVAQGLRAKLKSASLITGRLVLALDFQLDAAPATLAFGGPYPVVPTVPADLDVLAHSVEQVLLKVANLPLEPLIEDLRKTAQSTEQLLAGPEIRQAVATLNATLLATRTLVGDMKTLVENVDGNAAPMLTSITATARSAEATFSQARSTLAAANNLIGENSDIRHGTTILLKELSEAARSIRFLADYLEEHPEALIRGKYGSGE